MIDPRQVTKHFEAMGLQIYHSQKITIPEGKQKGEFHPVWKSFTHNIHNIAMAIDAFTSMINMMMYNVTNSDLKKLLKSVKPEPLWLSSPRSASRRACSLPLSTASFSKRRTVTSAAQFWAKFWTANKDQRCQPRTVAEIELDFTSISVYHILW